MDVDTKDGDVAGAGVEPAELRGLLDSLGGVNLGGEAFAVYKIGSDLDVSLPRRERKEGRGHRAFVVEGDPDMSFKEACSRRDFTINAILRDILTGEIVDPFDGKATFAAKNCGWFRARLLVRIP